MSRKLLYLCLIGCVLLVGMPLAVWAQNNPYKIKDHLYALYQKGLNQLRKPECLLYADSLYRQAGREGDAKAECMGAVLRMRHFTQYHNREDVEREVAFVKEVARRTNFDRYYYYASQLHCVWLLNHNFSLAALQMSEQMKREAYADNSPYGIYNCLRITGMIYYVRSNASVAADYYRQALDYTLEHLPEQSPSDAYLSLATCYGSNTNLDLKKGLEYARKSEETAKLELNRVKAMELQCEFLYKMERNQEFMEKYRQIMDFYRTTHTVHDLHYNFVQVYYYTLLKQYDTAWLYTDSITHPADRMLYKSHLSVKMGNYKLAFDLERKRQSIRDSLVQQLQTSDLAELTSQLETEILKQENMKLELRNADLRLRQATQEVELERSNASNRELALHNRDLELQQMKADAELRQSEADRQRMENERQREQLEQERINSHYQDTINTIIVCVLSLLILLLVLYVLKRRRGIKRLRLQNIELQNAHARTEEALRAAEEASRMKSVFVQNMSHEIRTPLNSIVGFSQLLADPELEFDEAERREFSQLILHNSDLLTTLVNDILALSALESGKYEMHSEEVCCNQVGQEAIATVEHRCPPGVRLHLTSEVKDDYSILSDGLRIKQVLINFLTNAEKFTEKGEICLHISLTEHPGSVTFAVTDTGKGIPPEMAEEIFERFRKLDSFKQGSGLGLNICRLIAERLGGEVRLDTAYTRGARFLFILPLQRA